MGLTAIGIIYSPWGKQSGAHLNPAVTLTFMKLGKVRPTDAVLYILAQFVGGWLGLALAAWVGGTYLADPAVNYVVTVPGDAGPIVAFAAETVISCGLMFAVLTFSNHKTLASWPGVCAEKVLDEMTASPEPSESPQSQAPRAPLPPSTVRTAPVV